MTRSISIDLSAVPQRITGAGRYGVEFVAAAQRIVQEYDFELSALVAKGDSQRIKSITGASTREFIPRNRVARLAYEKVNLGRVLKREGYSLHHGIHYTMPRGYSGKVVVTVHDTTLIDHPEWHERSKVTFFSREIANAAKFADGIIFPSNFVENRFRALFGESQPYCVIPHGVRTNLPSGDIDLTSILGADVLDAGYLLFCGTIEPRKNLERIVRAYFQSQSEHYLVLVGLQGWNMDEFLGRLALENKNSKVMILGFVGDDILASLYENALCTLYPSLEEGFGLPGLEAMAYGSPLISSKNSAMEEYSVEGVMLVDPTSVDEIAEAIVKVDHYGSELEKYKKLAKERSSHFTWERSGKAHLDFYRQVLEG